MPITFFSTVVGSIVLWGGWALIGQRIKSSGGGSTQVRYLRSYFLYMGIFLLLVTLPQLALDFNPARFPFLMAWGYIIGHVFSYVAIIQLLRLTLSLSPRLARFSKPAVGVIVTLAVAATIANVITMGFGAQPQFDSVNHVVLLNAAPIVGGLIGIMALACMLPTIVLFIFNGIVNPVARARSFLIAGGLIAVMVAGPMHDVAKTWQIYLLADFILILAYTILGTGVLYRFEERIAPARAASRIHNSAA